MNDVQERHHAWNILVQSCNMEEYDRLCQVIDKLEKSITTDGINNEYGIVDNYKHRYHASLYFLEYVRSIFFYIKNNI
jgi:hypothetical protein